MTSLLLLLLAASSPNLVVNPDYSQGRFDPLFWNLNRGNNNLVTWVCDPQDPGKYALELTGSGTDWAGASCKQVQVDEGDVFTIAAWVKSSGVKPETSYLHLRCFSDGKFLGQRGPEIPANAADWTLICDVQTLPEGCTVADASLQLWSQGTVTLGPVGLWKGDITDQIYDLLPAPKLRELVPVKIPHNAAADVNENGLSDSLETFLSIPGDARSTRQTRRETTCFQTPTGYRADNDLKVDSILVVNETEEAISSWQMMGYNAWFMTGFRDGQAYVDAHPGSVQQTADGRQLDCGPGSYYMVPTADRRQIKFNEFRRAFLAGATGAAPEEPEYIGTGGYSPTFKEEWQTYYNRPWEVPHSSVQARWDTHELMGHLQIELLRACYDGAKSVKPDTRIFLLAHSPLSYAGWNITFPHAWALRELNVSDFIAQVWTGTARSAVNHQGVRKERTFENAWLEYSSSLELVRGLDIATWFLMDPVEDNPDRPMDDYFYNYERTLGASLLFPETDKFEVMPWPTRIFGRVPDDFATAICNVVTALSDIQNYPEYKHDRGTEGIGTFLADTAMSQRNAPNPSDFDAIYGLCLPMLMRGIPVQIAHFDRITDPNYLDPYKVLLVSFDAFKPERQEQVDTLINWTKQGGQLLVFGGDDAYNDINSWWKDLGYASPHDYLLTQCGTNPRETHSLTGSPVTADFEVAVESDYTGRNLENEEYVWLDLSETAKETGAVFVRFTDTLPGDGWGPFISSLRQIGTRDGQEIDEIAIPGTPAEAPLVFSDTGSGVHPDSRFVDSNNQLVYLFQYDPDTAAYLEVKVGNQYRIEIAPAPAQSIKEGKSLRFTGWAQDLPELNGNDLRGARIYANHGGETVIDAPDGALLFEKPVGLGGIMVCGMNPAMFAKSPVADSFIRKLAQRGCEKADLEYQEQGHIGIQRGPYYVLKTFDEPYMIDEPMMDLLSADLAIRPAGELAPDGLEVLKRLPDFNGVAPVLAASSDCVDWQSTAGNELKLVVSGAEGVRGVIRLATGGQMVDVIAKDAQGKPIVMDNRIDGDTVVLRYASQPEGLGLSIKLK